MEIKVLIPGTIEAKGLLNLLFNADSIPDDVFVKDGNRLIPAKRFFIECRDIILIGAEMPKNIQ